MINFQDLIDKVKGKKSVEVKEHHRKQNNKDVIVDAYTKLIEKSDNETANKGEGESDLDDLDNLDSPEDSGLEMHDDDSEREEDLEIDPDEKIEFTKLEKSLLAKIKDDEVNGLIEKIKKSNKEEDWRQLYDKYMGILYYQANKYKTSNIPYNLVLLQAKTLMLKAVNTFDPKRGAKFNTHLTNYLKKLYRFVNENANIAKIPEQRVRKIKAYNWAYAKLEAKLGRPPIDIEMADELSWPIKEIARLKDELSRKEVLNFGTDYSYGDLGINSSKIDTVIRAVYLDASPDEKVVMEHITNIKNKPQLSVRDLSKKLKQPENKIKYMISNIKKNIIEYA